MADIRKGDAMTIGCKGKVQYKVQVGWRTYKDLRPCKRKGKHDGWCHQHHPAGPCRTREHEPYNHYTVVTTPDDGEWRYRYCRRCRRACSREFVSERTTAEALEELGLA